MPKPGLLIAGGSARAAAWCAVRAGLRVAALDRFNDLDLLAVADPCFKWDGSDRQVEEVVGDLGVPWMYVGPLENRPDLVARCERLAPLRGNGADVLRAVRDPFRVREVLRDAGFPTLDLRPEGDPPRPRADWLLKPRNGCGGRGIVVWREQTSGHPTLKEPHYFQELRMGLRFECLHASSAFEATADGARLMGECTWDAWVPDDPAPAWGRAAYGPQRAGRSDRSRTGPLPQDWERCLTAAFGLRGPCGIDFAGGQPDHPNARIVEVNPRFTATMELCGHSCGPFGNVDARHAPPQVTRAKRTVFAGHPVRVGELPVFGPHDGGWVADVPAPGTPIPARHPICTVFADPGQTADDAGATLDGRAAEVRATLTPP